MTTNKRTLRQPYYKGGRQPVGSAFIPELERAVQREMNRFGASRSFVIATAVGFALGVDEQADYRKVLKEKKR